ncbi:MAG: GntR family transcriptional regulator [Salinicola sp.]|uniref:GntR family transcriptional regulator n=1 Tax=Salinicola sp. TaxID=1978524 RepID=UPI000C8CC9D9|nr:GntR family transcriptional regulator [Salinicola sp.]MAM57776.1 GntR family transcriptional regulator [Salinicola sp.]NRB55216.1 GntR family transcriptional regulator [Salinicola sp.]
MTTTTSGFATIQQRDLVNQIADMLTEALLKGDFAPGVHLAEAQLARDFGVSRAPVREAARLLESRGMLVSQPRRGFFVRTFNAAELDDVYDLRLCLERHAVRLLAGKLTAEMEAALDAQLETMRRVANDGTALQQIEEDVAFHRMLCQFSGNQRLVRVFDELCHEMRFCILLIGQLYDDPAQVAESHQPVMDALRTRDANACEAAIDYHIGIAQQRVVEMFRERETR